MDGKLYFRDCCLKMGVDCDVLFQLGESKAYVQERFRHRFSSHLRKDSNRYAVCFFQKEGLYVAWDLKAKKAAKKDNFSLKKDTFPVNSLYSTTKAVEYRGWGEENVFVFYPQYVLDFLEYCKNI